MSLPSESVPATTTPSEQILNEKWDICFSNAVVKTGIGLGAGVIASVILFKRRMWPVNVGLGFGLGRAYGDCDRQFNPNSVPGWRLSKPSSSSTV